MYSYNCITMFFGCIYSWKFCVSKQWNIHIFTCEKTLKWFVIKLFIYDNQVNTWYSLVLIFSTIAKINSGWLNCTEVSRNSNRTLCCHCSASSSFFFLASSRREIFEVRSANSVAWNKDILFYYIYWYLKPENTQYFSPHIRTSGCLALICVIGQIVF